jgi:hypothetical protein
VKAGLVVAKRLMRVKAERVVFRELLEFELQEWLVV